MNHPELESLITLDQNPNHYTGQGKIRDQPLNLSHLPSIYEETDEMIDICGKGEWDEKAFILNDEYEWELKENEAGQPILVAYKGEHYSDIFVESD